MGTRSEIWVRDLGHEAEAEGQRAHNLVCLWKHWDGYPENMKHLFQRFYKFAVEMMGNNSHWLTYAEDMAGALIAFSYTEAKVDDPFGACRPDIRPRGSIRDAEYAWVLDLGDDEMTVTGYSLDTWDGLTANQEEDLRRGLNLSLEVVCEFTCKARRRAKTNIHPKVGASTKMQRAGL
jgi:hypothetical protein